MKRRRIILKSATRPVYGLKSVPPFVTGIKGDPDPAGVQLENKSVAARLEVKATADDGTVSIRAYGLAFGNIDSYGDIIMSTACDDFLKSEDADRMALCWQHDFTEVIGLITDKGVDDYGMWIEAKLLPTAKGKDASVLLKAGAVSEFSIGYRADRYHFEKRDGYDYDVRILDAITVYEVSPVTRAANPSARVVKVKRDDNQQNQVQPQKPKSTTMTPEEIKAMRESIEKAVNEKYAADIKAAQDAVNAMKTTVEEQKTSIDNLDQTINEQQATIKALEDKMKAKAASTFFGALRLAMEGKRDDIKALLAKNDGSLKLEFKVDTQTSDIANIAYNVPVDTSINAARAMPNVFYETLAKDTVSAMQFNWLEGQYTDATGYVDELQAPGDSKAAVTERTRKFGKIAAHLLVSSEVADFFEEVYNWARNTAQAKILQFADGEILNGIGADSGAGTSPKKVYGLKSSATAFTATGAKYKSATIADVILDAQMQAASHGFNLTQVYVSYADFANIRGLKNANGNYLYNEVTGLLGGLRILPTTRLTAGQMLFIDSTVVRLKERPVWELEIVRNAAKDGWDVYVRKALQTLVKGNDVNGVIWVASVATAIAAIEDK